jgi:IrrE N-terminal-like domain
VRHGFKAKAERLATELRAAVGLASSIAFDPVHLATHLDVLVLNVSDLPLTSPTRKRLLLDDADSWSGMTIAEAGITAIFLNPSHPLTRRNNTLMHELAHVVLKHVPARVDVSENGLLLLSHYSEDTEAEADWLAAALLLPRDALIARRRRGVTPAEIAFEYGTSEQLCQWRLRMTGVESQLRRATR